MTGGVTTAGPTAPDRAARRHSPRRRDGVVATTAGLLVAACSAAGDDASQVPAVAAGAPVLADQTAVSGVDHEYRGGFEFYVGGGVAVFDCDGDGRGELYLAGGSAPAALYRNESPVGGPLRFTPEPSPITDLLDVTGAYPLDVDGDSRLDLVVLRRGPNEILRGLGDCEFERATDALGLDGGNAWTVGFSATWEDRASLPTLAFGSYLELDRDGCDPHWLVRPDGDRYGDPIELTPAYCSLSLLFSDWGRTGHRDLRVSNDRHYYRDGQEQLWRIEAGVPPEQYTGGDGWQPLQLWGMGIASHDLTGDGRPEVFLTSQGDNKLQTLADGATGPEYVDIALARGATAHRPYTGGDALPSTAWHPEFGDVNNDGFSDLLVTKGNVEAQTDHAAKDPTNLLIGRDDGTFVEGAIDAGIVGFDRARGAALADLDLDGLLDLVVVHREAPVRVWHSQGSAGDRAGHWLGIRLRNDGPNVDAVGAWLEVRAGDRSWTRELTVGGGHAGGQLGWMHIGVGPAAELEVRVTWPDGAVGPWRSVEADRLVVLERADEDGDVVVREWSAPG